MSDVCSGLIMKLEVFSAILAIKRISVVGDNFEERRAGEWAKFTALLAIKAAARAAGDDGCQMAIAKLLDVKGLALRA